jgi:hypothetical protein
LRRNSLLGNGLQQMLRYSDFLPDLARDYFLFFQKISLAMADKYCIMKAQEKRKERKREREMENTTHINSFIRSLPRIVQKKVWKVTDKDGTVVQYVGSTDNKKYTAQQYINEKYPDRVLKLTFSHFNGLITIAR